MQSFQFKIQRIPGTRMGLADHMSRMYQDDLKLAEPDEHVVTQMALTLILSTHGTVELESDHTYCNIEIEEVNQELHDVNYYIGRCHGGR